MPESPKKRLSTQFEKKRSLSPSTSIFVSSKRRQRIGQMLDGWPEPRQFALLARTRMCSLLRRDQIHETRSWDERLLAKRSCSRELVASALSPQGCGKNHLHGRARALSC